jgi:hypothetical protein
MEVGQGPNWGCSARGKKIKVLQESTEVSLVQTRLSELLEVCYSIP